MAKGYGKVGFIKTVETEPGIWEPKETVNEYYWEMARYASMFQTSGGMNDNQNINTEVSIIADSYAVENFNDIRYIELQGAKWKVTSVDPTKYPKLILSIGGVWNGKSTT